jgi:hypothetical protein
MSLSLAKAGETFGGTQSSGNGKTVPVTQYCAICPYRLALIDGPLELRLRHSRVLEDTRDAREV